MGDCQHGLVPTENHSDFQIKMYVTVVPVCGCFLGKRGSPSFSFTFILFNVSYQRLTPMWSACDGHEGMLQLTSRSLFILLDMVAVKQYILMLSTDIQKVTFS